MDQFTGGCLCGNVRIVASGRPYRVGLCHCLDCRKHHGALFHASAVFPEDAVTIEGETRGYAGRFFCPRCGSSVFGRTGDEVLEIRAVAPAALGERIAARFGVTPRIVDQSLRIQVPRAHHLVAALVDEFGAEVERLTLSHPSLEDVFIARTGHRFFREEA